MIADLEALALTALCTPLVGAPDALEVLVDALIEDGTIDPDLTIHDLQATKPGRWRLEVPRGYASYTVLLPRLSESVLSAKLVQAYAWARGRLVVDLVSDNFVVIDGHLASTDANVRVQMDSANIEAAIDIELFDIAPAVERRLTTCRFGEIFEVHVRQGDHNTFAQCRVSEWRRRHRGGTTCTLRGIVVPTEGPLHDVEYIVMDALRETPIAGARVKATRVGPGSVRVHVDAPMSPHEVTWLLERVFAHLPVILHLEVTHTTAATIVSTNRRYSA